MLIPLEKIKPNPRQPRSKNPDVSDLLISMPKVGLVSPITVAKDGAGSYVLIAGHRRLYAAQKLKWSEIECSIIDASDPKLDIGRIMAENEAREDLTGQQRANGYQTMIELGWSDAEILQATGGHGTESELKAVRALATLSKSSREKMPVQASLEELAAFAEFSGRAAITDDLLRNIGTSNFVHRVSFWRDKKALDAKVVAAIESIKKDGVTYVPKDDIYNGRFMSLRDWRLKEAKVDAENHVTCPGHTATVDYHGEIEYYCSQPALHGITGVRGAVKSEDEKNAERLKRQLRTIWRASAPIRQEFVTAQLGLKKLDAGLFAWALTWAVKYGLSSFEGYLCDAAAYTKSKDAMYQVAAISASTAEKVIDDWIKDTGCVTDPHQKVVLVAYFKALNELSYPMSTHEVAFMTGTKFVPPVKS